MRRLLLLWLRFGCRRAAEGGESTGHYWRTEGKWRDGRSGAHDGMRSIVIVEEIQEELLAGATVRLLALP